VGSSSCSNAATMPRSVTFSSIPSSVQAVRDREESEDAHEWTMRASTRCPSHECGMRPSSIPASPAHVPSPRILPLPEAFAPVRREPVAILVSLERRRGPAGRDGLRGNPLALLGGCQCSPPGAIHSKPLRAPPPRKPSAGRQAPLGVLQGGAGHLVKQCGTG
jgi:hypothetical protein